MRWSLIAVIFRTRTQPSAVLVLGRFAWSSTSTISLSTSTIVWHDLVAFAEKCRFHLDFGKFCFRSAVKSHHGLAVPPLAKLTTDRKTSTTHGSCLALVIVQSRSYISYASNPNKSSGFRIPSRCRSATVAGPTLGKSSRDLTNSLFTLAGFTNGGHP